MVSSACLRVRHTRAMCLPAPHITRKMRGSVRWSNTSRTAPAMHSSVNCRRDGEAYALGALALDMGQRGDTTPHLWQTLSMSMSMEIPDFLKTQVREGKVVLVFGAGASTGAVSSTGATPPVGAALGKLLSDRFLGGKFGSAPLSQISEYAISESSLIDVQEFIRGVFEDFEPAPFHRLVPRFRWHGLATTNYDRIVEKAYQAEKNRLQTLTRPCLRPSSMSCTDRRAGHGLRQGLVRKRGAPGARQGLYPAPT